MTHCCVLLHGLQIHSSSSSQIQKALLLKPAAHGVINAECDWCYPYEYLSESTNIDTGSLSMHWNSLEYTGTIWFQWFRIIRYSFISYELWFTESILRIKRNWRLRIMAQLTHVDYSYNSGHSNYQDFIFWQNLQCWWYKNFDLIDKTVNFATMMAIERMWLNA